MRRVQGEFCFILFAKNNYYKKNIYRRNLPKPVVASMLHDDVVNYSEHSANAFASKFDKMLAEWKIDVNETDWSE